MQINRDINKDVEAAIESILPLELQNGGRKVAALLKGIIDNELRPSEVQSALLNDKEVRSVFLFLSGKSVSTSSNTLIFGESSQAGDVTIRDIAGNNILNINLNTQTKPELLRYTSNRVFVSILALIALLVVVLSWPNFNNPDNIQQSGTISIDGATFTDNGELELAINNKTENTIVIKEIIVKVLEDFHQSVSPVMEPTAIYRIPIHGLQQGESQSVNIKHSIAGRNAESILIDFETYSILRLRVTLIYDRNKTISIEGITFLQRVWQ